MGSCITRSDEEEEANLLKAELLRTQEALLKVSERLLVELQKKGESGEGSRPCSQCSLRRSCILDRQEESHLFQYWGNSEVSTPSLLTPNSDKVSQWRAALPRRPATADASGETKAEALPTLLARAESVSDRGRIAQAVQLTLDLSRTHSLCTHCAYYRIYSRTPRKDGVEGTPWDHDWRKQTDCEPRGGAPGRRPSSLALPPGRPGWRQSPRLQQCSLQRSSSLYSSVESLQQSEMDRRDCRNSSVGR